MANVESTLPDASSATSFEQNIFLTAKGGSVLFIGKLFTFLSRFIVTLLLTRLLGPEQYGLYNIGLSVAALAQGVALMGLDTALVRYVALYRARRDDAGVWGAIQVALGISTAASALVSALVFGLAHVIATEIFHAPELAPVLQLISFTVPILGVSDVLAGATRGFKKMEYMVIAQNLVQPLVRVVLLMIFALVGLNILGAVLIFGVADFVASLLLIYFLNRQFTLKRRLGAARREPRQLLVYSVPMWLSDLITTFRASIQTILLGSLNSVFTVGIFSVANQINLVADLVQTSVTAAVRPIIVEVHERRNREQLGRLYQIVSKWMFAFNLPVFLIVVLFPQSILSIFGKSFVEGATALVLLSWASLVDAATGMCGAVLDMTGYTRLKLANAIVRLALVVMVSLWLIPTWGIVGAALAALTGEVVVNVLRVLEVYVLLRLLPFNPSSFKPVGAGLVALLAVVAVGEWLPPLGVGLNVLLQGALLASIYGSTLLMFGLDPEERMLFSRFRRRATQTISPSTFRKGKQTHDYQS